MTETSPQLRQRSPPNRQRSAPNRQRSAPNRERSAPNRERSAPNRERFGPDAPAQGRNGRVARSRKGLAVVALPLLLLTALGACSGGGSSDNAPPVVSSAGESELAALEAADANDPANGHDKRYPTATHSGPIALSLDNRLLWVVNPDDDSVSVIRTDTRVPVAKIKVGNEPQGVAIDPANRYAYVANAASSNVSVIRIHDADPNRFRAEVETELLTGAEPWNIVAAPDGRRFFVANSSQDTITVISAYARRIVGHIDLRNSACNDPDRNRHFQPRGLAVTADSSRLYATRFLSFTNAGGVQADDLGKEGLVCQLKIDTHALGINKYQPVKAITIGAQPTGFHGRQARAEQQQRRRRPRRHLRVRQPIAEHRDPWRSGVPTQHRRVAEQPAAVQHDDDGVRQCSRRRQRRYARATQVPPSS